MSIFDDEESIVLRKAIERDREWQKKTSNNPFDYSRISNDAQARLEYSDDQRNRKVIDAAMSFGPGAIQKIGSGQVFGKLAKAVRKFMSNRNVTSRIVDKVNRVSTGSDTFTIMEMKSPQFDKLLSDRRALGITEPNKSSTNWIALKNTNDMPTRMHEIGHQFNQRLNPDIGNNSSKLGLFNPKEVQADVFAKQQGHSLNRYGIEDEMNALYEPLIQKYGEYFKNTKINTYPK